MGEILNEVRMVTANIVAKKQDAAKLNYPKIIEKIRKAAQYGESLLLITTDEMNEYDKELLTVEGFNCTLIDQPNQNYYNAGFQYQMIPQNPKVWQIKW